MNTIHHKWLQPAPSWYQDFADRDDPRLDPDWHLPKETPPSGSPRPCSECGATFTPTTPQGNHRKTCYQGECEKARKRRNGTASARRVAERKRAQQA